MRYEMNIEPILNWNKLNQMTTNNIIKERAEREKNEGCKYKRDNFSQFLEYFSNVLIDAFQLKQVYFKHMA